MDLRKFQDCRFFLLGACHKGAACPFAHDEVSARRRSSKTMSPQLYASQSGCSHDDLQPPSSPDLVWGDCCRLSGRR